MGSTELPDSLKQPIQQQQRDYQQQKRNEIVITQEQRDLQLNQGIAGIENKKYGDIPTDDEFISSNEEFTCLNCYQSMTFQSLGLSPIEFDSCVDSVICVDCYFSQYFPLLLPKYEHLRAGNLDFNTKYSFQFNLSHDFDENDCIICLFFEPHHLINTYYKKTSLDNKTNNSQIKIINATLNNTFSIDQQGINYLIVNSQMITHTQNIIHLECVDFSKNLDLDKSKYLLLILQVKSLEVSTYLVNSYRRKYWTALRHENQFGIFQQQQKFYKDTYLAAQPLDLQINIDRSDDHNNQNQPSSEANHNSHVPGLYLRIRNFHKKYPYLYTDRDVSKMTENAVIQYPVRSYHHLQPFDLVDFIHKNSYGNNVQNGQDQHWLCPICNKHKVFLNELQPDFYLFTLINTQFLKSSVLKDGFEKALLGQKTFIPDAYIAERIRAKIMEEIKKEEEKVEDNGQDEIIEEKEDNQKEEKKKESEIVSDLKPQQFKMQKSKSCCKNNNPRNEIQGLVEDKNNNNDNNNNHKALSQPTSKSKESIYQPKNLVLSHSQQENIDFVTQKLQEFRFVRKTTEKVATLPGGGGDIKKDDNADQGQQGVIQNVENSLNTKVIRQLDIFLNNGQPENLQNEILKKEQLEESKVEGQQQENTRVYSKILPSKSKSQDQAEIINTIENQSLSKETQQPAQIAQKSTSDQKYQSQEQHHMSQSINEESESQQIVNYHNLSSKYSNEFTESERIHKLKLEAALKINQGWPVDLQTNLSQFSDLGNELPSQIEKNLEKHLQSLQERGESIEQSIVSQISQDLFETSFLRNPKEIRLLMATHPSYIMSSLSAQDSILDVVLEKVSVYSQFDILNVFFNVDVLKKQRVLFSYFGNQLLQSTQNLSHLSDLLLANQSTGMFFTVIAAVYLTFAGNQNKDDNLDREFKSFNSPLLVFGNFLKGTSQNIQQYAEKDAKIRDIEASKIGKIIGVQRSKRRYDSSNVAMFFEFINNLSLSLARLQTLPNNINKQSKYTLTENYPSKKQIFDRIIECILGMSVIQSIKKELAFQTFQTIMLEYLKYNSENMSQQDIMDLIYVIQQRNNGNHCQEVLKVLEEGIEYIGNSEIQRDNIEMDEEEQEEVEQDNLGYQTMQIEE